MTAFLWIYLLIGPALVLAVWIWLRSRREPVAIVEPLEIGRVLAGAFQGFADWRTVVLAILIVGASRTMGMLIVHTIVPPLVVGMPMNQRIGAGFLIGGGIGVVDSLLGLFFQVPAVYAMIRAGEGEAEPWRGALSVTIRCILPAIALTMLGLLAGILAMAAFIVPVFILLLNWLVVLPVLVAEDRGVFAIFIRSRQLAIGSRGRMLVTLLVFGVGVGAVALAASWIPRSLGFASFPVRTAVTVVTQVVNSILGVGFVSTLYIELRRIRDGMSVPALAEVFA